MSDSLSGDSYLGESIPTDSSSDSNVHVALYHSNDEQIFTQSVDLKVRICDQP